jgi:hypothetical protein
MSQTSKLITVSPRLLDLAQTLDDLLRHKKSGAALPECYGDEIGAKNWAHFVRKSDPSVQYTFQSEVNAIHANGGAIADLIKNDPDFDASGLIIIEKGGGSHEARLAKPISLMRFFESAGMNISLYSGWERSAEYRQEGATVVSNNFPAAEVRELDVDFNQDDPDISVGNVTDVERPRIVMEFGSSRGNIATSEADKKSFEDQTYEELQRRFAHDRKNCRDGGILIVGSDANQGASVRNAYVHPVHANFAENIVHRGAREGALSSQFNPQLLYYDPIWDEAHHVVRHTLIASASQDFGILSARGHFQAASIREDDHFVLSHSIKWPVQKMVMAAESQGFKCLGVFWGEDKRVPVYVFKAVPVTPALKLVA